MVSSDEDDLVGPPVPKNLQLMQTVDEGSDDLIGPPIPDEFQNHDGSDNEGTVDESNTFEHLADFRHGTKAITALTVDAAGARFASGSLDYEVKFWDFAGMDGSLRSFRSMYPCGNHPIRALAYSTTGDNILIVSGMAQAKVYDRDGHEVLECVKGDQYIADMSRTNGHTAALTDGCWNPRVREEFVTSAEDGTCRVWHVSNAYKHKSIIKCRSRNGLKTNPTTCAYNRDGLLIACVCQDGSFQLWDTRKMFINPTQMIRDAHQNQSETSRIAFSYLGHSVCTRGGDDTLKLWDVRAFKRPVATANGLYSRYASTDCAFSPDDRHVTTGTSVSKGEPGGTLEVFAAADLSPLRLDVICESHVIKTQWHPRLDQVFVGCGDGIVRVYDGGRSGDKGAKLCATKTRVRRVADTENVSARQIITPHALPMFRQDRFKSARKMQEKERQDPVKSHRPDLPIKTGQGGRVAATGSTLSSYVIRNLGLSKRVEDDQDPREAILKYAKEAAENPYWVTPAYKRTQPQTIFEQEDQGPSEKKSKS